MPTQYLSNTIIRITITIQVNLTEACFHQIQAFPNNWTIYHKLRGLIWKTSYIHVKLICIIKIPINIFC